MGTRHQLARSRWSARVYGLTSPATMEHSNVLTAVLERPWTCRLPQIPGSVKMLCNDDLTARDLETLRDSSVEESRPPRKVDVVLCDLGAL